MRVKSPTNVSAKISESAKRNHVSAPAVFSPGTKTYYPAERNPHNECQRGSARRTLYELSRFFVPVVGARALNLMLVNRHPFFFYLFQSPTPPQYVFWYHNDRMINYDTTRGSVTVQTDPGPTQSRLTIRQAVEADTGNYTCSASNTKPASIFVFVTEGEYASMSK